MAEITQAKLDAAKEKFSNKYYDLKTRYLESVGDNVVLTGVSKSNTVSKDYLRRLGAEHPCILAGYDFVEIKSRESESYPKEIDNVPIFYYQFGTAKAQNS